MNKSIKAALFDLDGVILDTESQYSDFWGQMGNDYRPDVEGFANRIKGQTLTQIFSQWFDGNDMVQEEITRRLNAFEQQMSYIYIKGSRAYVESLHARGIATAIVTSSNRPKMQQVMHAHPEFTMLFDDILTSEDFAASKPDPDCYITAAQRFGLLPAECAVFEDSINGLRAGRAAGCYVVGLATTNPRSIIEPLADIVIDDFTVPTLP